MKVYCIMLVHYDVDTYRTWLELKKIFSLRETAITWLKAKGCVANEYYSDEYFNRFIGEWYEIVEMEVE